MDLTILSKMFPEGAQEKDVPLSEMIILATKSSGQEDESLLWERAAFYIENNCPDLVEWIPHFIKIAQAIDRRNLGEGEKEKTDG